MLDRFLKYRIENSLGSGSENILVAVSGGIDSVTLSKLYSESGFKFAIAHCNFQLRAQESEGDEEFVRKLAKSYNCQLFTKRFNTLEYADNNKISVQMAARDLRYNWFKQIARQNGFDYIAIAHNRNDIAETMLINLIRGTGLKGLTGIKPKHANIIRPLLFASRNEIVSYAETKGLEFREDSSNKETKYQRNLIRSKIIPLMEQINPALLDTLIQESEIFNSSFQLYQKEIESIRRSTLIKEGSVHKISISKLLSLRLTAPVFFDLLSPYKFTYSDTLNILSSLESGSGKQFHSELFTLVKDRAYLLIERKNKIEETEYPINEGEMRITYPFHIELNQFRYHPGFIIPKDNKTVALDCDKLLFPLKLRHWREGDYFVPLGMKGRKKLSDFFIDQKLNILDKKKVWLLTSNNVIVWIVGMQINDHYKVSSETQNILSLSIND